MLGKVRSCAIIGLQGVMVEVEVDISPGLPNFHMVGLPDAAVSEAAERVRSAIRNSGFQFPGTRIAVNLAPADLKKESPAYDLPIALAILIASKQLAVDLSDHMLLGELSFDGSLRHTSGILPMVSFGVERGLYKAMVPEADAKEAALVKGVTVLGVKSLFDLAAHLRGEVEISPTPQELIRFDQGMCPGLVDFTHIKGQEHAKRALEVAAAGGHNIVMTGPPGSGKTLMARSLPGILPRLTQQEALEVTKIYSVGGALSAEMPMVTRRPFRSPHYTTSMAGAVETIFPEVDAASASAVLTAGVSS